MALALYPHVCQDGLQGQGGDGPSGDARDGRGGTAGAREGAWAGACHGIGERCTFMLPLY